MEWNAALYDGSHGFVPAYGLEVLDMLGDLRRKSVLDAGCGTGVLTEEIYRRGGRALGVDADENMLALARKKYPHLRFERRDLCDLGFTGAFDCVFSNAVLHWIKRQDKALENFYAALKPGGVLAAEMGGAGNADIVLSALKNALAEAGAAYENAFYYRGEEFGSELEKAGFTVLEMRLFPRMTAMSGEDGLANWIRQFCPQALKAAGEQADRVLDKVKSEVAEKLFFNGAWHVDYMRLRFKAIKEK